jgi:exosortase K
LLAWLTPVHPVYESGVGYVDFARGIIVAPACAGINFMIMSFGLGALYGITRIRRMVGLFVWLVAMLCGAYGYTLMVNTWRILISMILYDAHIYTGWLTLARVHRLAGIGIYLTALWGFFFCLRRLTGCGDRFLGPESARKEHPLPGWLPLFWYVAGAAGVPLVNGLFQQRDPYLGEHCLTILIAVACFWGVLKLAGRLSAYWVNKKRGVMGE